MFFPKGGLIRAAIVFLGLASSPYVAAAPDGAQLFETYCVVCHRADGTGSLGLPLEKSKFATLTDDYLIKTIRHGRPGRVMPPFQTLSDAQVEAVVGFLRKWSDTQSPEEQAFTANGDLTKGEELFATHCTSCHGEAGQGAGTGTGVTYSRKREFAVIPPAVGNKGFLASASDAMLKRTISNGREGTIMPAYLKQGFTEKDVEDVVSYLRSLENTESEGIDFSDVPTSTLVVESSEDFETTVKNVKAALTGSNFRIFPDRYLEEGLFFDTEVNKKQLTIRFCNFNELYGLLKTEPRLGMALPCRITVVEDEEGQVKLIAMNMVVIARMFNNDQLLSAAHKMQQTIVEILEEATF